MLLRDARLIFLHLPKTGGNSISRLLLPHADDRMVVSKHQDGIDRFEITGRKTARKHATLGNYRDALGPRLARYRVAIAVRDPLHRAVSHYFSPNRWFRLTPDGWQREAPRWSIDAFADFVARTQRLIDFLLIDGVVRRPDFILRHDYLELDLARLVSAVGLDVRPSDLPHANRSAATPDQVAHALADPAVQAIVARRFAADYGLLRDWGVMPQADAIGSTSD